MRKNGFTLIELLAVIIILAVIALIATPIVLDVVESAKKSSFESSAYGMIDAMKLKSMENMLAGNSMAKEYDFSVDKLDIQGDQLNGLGSVDNEGRIAIAVYNGDWCATKGYSEGTITIKDYVEGECTLPVEGNNDPVVYKDNSGANTPDLLDNMIPVHYIDANEDGTYEWVYADVTKEWYDYEAKEWANAVVLNSGITKSVGDTILESEIALWYVWIPRYTYKIFNGNNESVAAQVIEIEFESGTSSNGTVTCVDAINSKDAEGNIISKSEDCTDKNGSIVNGKSTYTHPAFNFGGVPLTGFWVGKFEISGTTTTEGAIDAITIKPNVDSLRDQTVSAFFTAIQNMSTTYSLNGDSHMMKNMEWGAVAYLKQSEYGLGTTEIGINNYYNNGAHMTGCGVAATTSGSSTTCNAYNTENGMLASTTGNVYGVYDMSGGAFEYTMGNMVDSSGAFYSSNAGFTAETTPAAKYYDAYTNDSSNRTHARGKLGDATKETLATFGSYNGGWTSDSTNFPHSSESWFIRGGHYSNGTSAGVFNFFFDDGAAYSICSARAVLVR